MSPAIINPSMKKPSFKERFVLFNKALTKWSGMREINKFIYSLFHLLKKVVDYVRSQEGYEAARNQTINTLFTGLLIGFAIWCMRTGNSFLLGIFVAIMLVIIEGYIEWLHKLLSKKKK